MKIRKIALSVLVAGSAAVLMAATSGKPNGGNPLNLQTRGIPHLFIVNADGTLVEEGHPMKIFNEETFRSLK